MFSTTSQVLKKWSYNFHSKCQNTFCTLTSCPWVCQIRIYEKNRPKSSLQGKVCNLFSKNCVFNASYVLEIWCHNNHSKCQKNFCTLINCPLGFVRLDNTRKNEPKKFFFTGKIAFFSKTYVVYNSLDPKEMIIYIPK